jgi:hypothetical protein
MYAERNGDGTSDAKGVFIEQHTENRKPKRLGIEAPWLVNGGHGASIKNLGHHTATNPRRSLRLRRLPPRGCREPSALQSKRPLIKSRWVPKPLAFAGEPRPRRLNS